MLLVRAQPQRFSSLMAKALPARPVRQHQGCFLWRYLSSLLRPREEFESDKCIFTGSVRSNVATWRDDVIFRCNDPHFQSKNENFKMKLHVKNGSVDVILNSINLGSITTQGQNTARGGMLGENVIQ